MPLLDFVLDRLARLVGEPKRDPTGERAIALPASPKPELEPEVDAELDAEPEPPSVEPDPAFAELVHAAMSEVPKAVAAGVVDVRSGALLGASAVESHPELALERVAAATRELIEHRYFSASEVARGADPEDTRAHEGIVLSADHVHLFARLPDQPQAVLVVVSQASANLGLARTKLRQVLPPA